MARSRSRPAPARRAARSIGQLLVVTGGGTLIGGVLVLLAFPGATPFDPPVLLGAAAALTIATAWAAIRLGGEAPTSGRTPRSPRKPATKKTGTKKRRAPAKAARKKKAAPGKAAGGRRAPAQGRGRR